MGAHCTPFRSEGSKLVAKIEVLTVVPSEYVPQDKTDCNRWEQYLTIKLVEQFPQLLDRVLEKVPYLNNLDVKHGDIESNYESGTGACVRDGFWINVDIEMEEPDRPQPTLTFRVELQSAIYEWFRKKGMNNVRMVLDVRWTS